MTDLFPYLLKSTVCLTVYYLLFRITLRKDTFFTLNRMLLIGLVVLSLATPIVKLPNLLNKEIEVTFLPNKQSVYIPEMSETAVEIKTTQNYTPIETTQMAQAEESIQTAISYQSVFITIYLLGFIISIFILLIGLAQIAIRLFKAEITKKEGYKLAIIDNPISPMSFGKYILISRTDYRKNPNEIIEHERMHIQFRHTYDLLLLEIVKIFHWFNPLIYALVKDLKELQEYQVDRKIINSGFDSKAYQLLMIKKCVGTERYALANSFNHCQIKNRIVMMNNQKTKKSKSWKVAIFLPVAVLMLMAFGSKKSKVPIDGEKMEKTTSSNSKKEWKENTKSFVLVPRGSIEKPSKNGTNTVSIDSFWISNEITNKEFRKFYKHVLNNPNDSVSWIEYSGINNYGEMKKPIVVSKSYSDILDKLIDEKKWQSIDKEYFTNTKYDNSPVIGVNSNGANYYCIWRTKEEKKHKKDKLSQFNYRIPTEWEWEYAASLIEQINQNETNVGSDDMGFRIVTSVFPEEKSSKLSSSKKVWTEVDFTMPQRIEGKGFMSRSIKINSDFQLVVNNKTNDWEEAAKLIHQLIDYDCSADNLKECFEKQIINDTEVMIPQNIFLTVYIDNKTPDETHRKLLNFIGSEIEKTRNKYANKVYKTSYDKLSASKRNDIENVVPAHVNFQRIPIEISERKKSQELKIEFRAEGIYVLPDKNVFTLEEMKQRIQEFKTEQDNWMIDVFIAAGFDDAKTDEIKKALKDVVNSGVRYLTFDPAYVITEQMAEFPGGEKKLRDWLSQNIEYPETAAEKGITGKVYVKFIVNSKGKVSFPKVARGLSPDLDKEALRVVSQMPDWIPAKQNGIPVSLSYTVPIRF